MNYKGADFKNILTEKLSKEKITFYKEEFNEIIKAIRSLSAGPKGMMLKGQTKHLLVADAKYGYE